jgi:hypothetical protein
VTRIGDDQGIAFLRLPDHGGHGLAHGRQGGLAIEHEADPEATLRELCGPVVGVVDATAQIALGTGIIVDADAKRMLAHADLLY